MFVKTLVILAVVAVVSGQRGLGRKRGECPPLPNVGICNMTCFADDHCQGNFKCCRTACGGTFCVPPVSGRRVQTQEKPGFCPVTSTGPWVCSSRCALDLDCRGGQKCCRNRCGAMACTNPGYNK